MTAILFAILAVVIFVDQISWRRLYLYSFVSWGILVVMLYTLFAVTPHAQVHIDTAHSLTQLVTHPNHDLEHNQRAYYQQQELVLSVHASLVQFLQSPVLESQFKKPKYQLGLPAASTRVFIVSSIVCLLDWYMAQLDVSTSSGPLGIAIG